MLSIPSVRLQVPAAADTRQSPCTVAAVSTTVTRGQYPKIRCSFQIQLTPDCRARAEECAQEQIHRLIHNEPLKQESFSDSLYLFIHAATCLLYHIRHESKAINFLCFTPALLHWLFYIRNTCVSFQGGSVEA